MRPEYLLEDAEQVTTDGEQAVGMSESELLASLENEWTDVRRGYTNDINLDREANLKAYNQEKYGDEVPGQSQVVASDVRDVVEMMLPDLVEPMVGNEPPVMFEPVGDDDVDAAEAESDAVHYVVTQQNEGYLNAYTAAKDVLLSKNAYAMVYWSDTKAPMRETYTGLNLLQLGMVMEDPEVTVTAGRVNETPEGPLFDVLVRRNRTKGQVCVVPLAPERVWVNRYHNSPNLDTARTVIVQELLMESDLIEDGYDPALVKKLPSWNGFANAEEIERWRKEGGTPGSINTPGSGAQRVVSVLNYFTRVDFDGDGIAELRWIRKGDGSDVLLDNEEIDTIPVISYAGIINTHKHNAVAVADTLLDLQKIRTVILRQGLNRMYLENYGRTILNNKMAGPLAYADLMAPRPGGVVRVDDMNAVKTDYPNPQPGNSMAWFQQIDTMRADRVGINRDTQGLDPKAFNDMNNPIGMTILNRAQARLKMLLRNMMETGQKNLYLRVHEILCKKGSPITLERGGSYEVVNPREWRKRERMLVKVGTGSANRMEKMALADAVLAKQEKIIGLQGGISGPFVVMDDVARALKDWSRAAGAPMGRYFSDGSDWTPPPPEQTPEQLYAEAKAKETEANAVEKSVKLQMDERQQRFDMGMAMWKQASSNYFAALKIEAEFGQQEGVNAEPVTLPDPDDHKPGNLPGALL